MDGLMGLIFKTKTQTKIKIGFSEEELETIMCETETKTNPNLCFKPIYKVKEPPNNTGSKTSNNVA
jgi:hypothetical protein